MPEQHCTCPKQYCPKCGRQLGIPHTKDHLCYGCKKKAADKRMGRMEG